VNLAKETITKLGTIQTVLHIHMLLFCLQFCSKQNYFKAIKMSQEDSQEYFQPEIGKIVQDHSACAKKKNDILIEIVYSKTSWLKNKRKTLHKIT